MAAKIRADFTTLTLTLIPVAIVINIVVGQIVQNVLKLPIYLDSVGTVLVAVLAGPLAGALTGALSNILWGIIFSSPQSMPFAITALVIGLVAGTWARLGWFRRELPMTQGLVLVAVVGVVLTLFQGLNSGPIGAGLALVLTVIVLILTALRVFPALVAVGGVLTGIIAAIVSAPISAFVFGGVMGSGTDLFVALFEATGANILQATLGQGLVSDPFDKFISFVVVWVILRGLSRRYLSRFPRASNVIEAR
jgi:energy-coupling factor transport system substrate-specific component